MKENHMIYKAAIYCRLSLDDGTTGDSSSIQTQKLMLEKYCREQGFTIVDFYIDDGYSGLNFNRPSFQRMISDIEQGKVNMVITKDLSRLGRDYIQTGFYTEVFFPDKNIRYIAVNDNVDTIRNDNDIAPFKNILNDMYARDLSRKIKSAKRQRAMNGMFICGQTPFGYKKDPANHNHLIIDEEAASIVKFIFELALNGKGAVVISKELIARQVITPSAYKVKHGDTRFLRHRKNNPNWECFWNYATVRAILVDQVYVGDMINGKYHIPNYKTKRRVRNAKENHIIVQNTHEAIISRDNFERVQQLIKTRIRPQRHNHENVFKSLVFCQECGWRMALVWATKRDKKVMLYKCVQHAHYPDRCKYHNGIKYDSVKQIVAERIRALFTALKDDDSLFEMLKQKMPKESETTYAEDKLRIEKRLSFLLRATKLVYDDFLNNKIDENTYSQLINEYQSEQKNLNIKLKEIEKTIQHQDNYLDSFQKLKEALNKFLDFKELTIEMVHKLIDKIEIEPIKKDQGKTTREIKIYWRFIN